MIFMPHHPAQGFTLIETMVTVAVAGILLAIGIPSFQSAMNSSRLTSTTNELIGGLNQARSDAVRLNSRVSLCASADGASCTANGDWAGWIVFTNPNDNAAVDAGEVVLRASTIRPTVPVRANAVMGGNIITFSGDGLPHAAATGDPLIGGVVTVCIPTTQPAENTRTITITPAGVRTARANTAGACP
ncbi:MAG: hypothetical protein B7Y40_09175 [Gammaproteobacteria bacterium 28-57-27]|nr:MAG: hypothetical protein B7Y40_09175 [Gammaproteobacteria bacterium 28-57-27]